KTCASGWTHSNTDQDFRETEGSGFSRIGPALFIWREDRAPPSRQREPDVRHDPSGIRAGVVKKIRESDLQTFRYGAGHRTDRQRQDEHLVFRYLSAE